MSSLIQPTPPETQGDLSEIIQQLDKLGQEMRRKPLDSDVSSAEASATTTVGVFEERKKRPFAKRLVRELRRTGRQLRAWYHVDPEWYMSAYPEVGVMGMKPVRHYVKIGKAAGNLPNLKAYNLAFPPQPEDALAGFSRFGARESGGKGEVIAFQSDVAIAADFNLTIGVHLHLYYAEMAEEFSEYLANIPVDFDLMISVPEGAGTGPQAEKVFRENLPRLRRIILRETQNIGRDIYPFVSAFKTEVMAYDLVLHLHTKRSPHQSYRAWRRFLLHNLLGSKAVVTQILNGFHQKETLGAHFPPYAGHLGDQPSWGSNFEPCQNMLTRIGLELATDQCPDFPAGSFFWARTDALRPLFTADLGPDDFDPESGQIDGTPAHAIERLFGYIPLAQGYLTEMRYVDQEYCTVNFIHPSVKNLCDVVPEFDHDRREDILAYQAAVTARAVKQGRIAVVTAIMGPFDALLLPDTLEADVDYFCFTDSVTDGYGVFHLIEPPYIDAVLRRSARFIKTNALKYLSGYDYVVWVDANVQVRVPVTSLVQRVAEQGAMLGAIPHPVRYSCLDEAKVIVAEKIDDPQSVLRQMESYSQTPSAVTARLIESNVLVMDARAPELHHAMRIWWREINNFSLRDQLSLTYALCIAGVDWCALLEEDRSTRDSDEFRLFQHGINTWWPKGHIYAAWHHMQHQAPLQLSDLCLAPQKEHNNLDIVICVHDGLADREAFLASLTGNLPEGSHLILVDDGSGPETAQFLANYAEIHGATLVRHRQSLGPTKAANAGIKAGRGRNVALLNSGTLVPKGALEKLCAALGNDPQLGVVGPLSIAASTQSLPAITPESDQAEINILPQGIDATVLDTAFGESDATAVARGPLVYDFCLVIKRQLFTEIGLLDQITFPHGYGAINDFCFRVSDAGHDLGILTSTYVFHAEAKGDPSAPLERLMQAGQDALVARYGEFRVRRSVATMVSQPQLVAARAQAKAIYDAIEAEEAA